MSTDHPITDTSEHAAPTARPSSLTWSVPKRPALVVLIAILIIAGGAIGYGIGDAGTSSAPGRISVSGSDTVMGMSNLASFQIGVRTTNANANTCLNYNNHRIEVLEKALEKNDVTKAEMQTSNLSLYDNTNQYGHITGFTVNDTLTVTMSAIADVGKAIEAAARTAGDGVVLDNISFSITKDSQLMLGARETAMHNATAEAADLVQGTGAKLAGVISITDEEVQPVVDNYGEPLNDFSASAEGIASVPIEAGRQSLTVQVSVVYALSN